MCKHGSENLPWKDFTNLQIVSEVRIVDVSILIQKSMFNFKLIFKLLKCAVKYFLLVDKKVLYNYIILLGIYTKYCGSKIKLIYKVITDFN